MKLKQVLTNYFEHQNLSVSAKTDFESLEKNILAKIGKKQKNSYSLRRKYFFLPTIMGLVILLIGGGLLSQRNPLRNTPLVQPASAQEILENMQASISSERLRFRKEVIGTGPVYENSPKQITETWLDRKTNAVRIDQQDSRETFSSIIINGAPPRSTMYRFIPVGETTVDKEMKKTGIFVRQANRDGYEPYIDELLKTDYINIQKKQGLTVDPVYESITYQGHEAYKITLNYTKHKPIQNEWTAILTIDKETHLPYERLDIQKEPEQFGGKVSQMKTTYTFSTDFSDDVFALNAPAEWTVMDDPKIVNFNLGTVEGYKEDEAQTSENAWRIPRIVNVIISNDKYPKEREDGHQNIIMAQGGMIPVGYTFKLFIVKKIFAPSDTPINSKDLTYEEIKPAETHSEQSYSTISAYSLPEIPGNTYDPKNIVMLKLEITDSKGKHYEVEKGFLIEELSKVEYAF